MELFVATYKSKYAEDCIDKYISKKQQDTIEIVDTEPTVDDWYCVICHRPNCNIVICKTCGYSRYKDIADAVSVLTKYQIEEVENFPLMSLTNPIYLKYYTTNQLKAIAEFAGLPVEEFDISQLGQLLIERNRQLFWVTK